MLISRDFCNLNYLSIKLVNFLLSFYSALFKIQSLFVKKARNHFMSVSFFSPIYKGSKKHSIERCAFLRSSIHLFNFGQQAYHIHHFDNQSIHVKSEKKGIKPSWIGVTLRVIVIATVIIPLIALLGAIVYRSLNRFQVMQNGQTIPIVNPAFLEGQELLSKINELKRVHEPQEKAIKLIRQSKKNSPEDEFERLSGAQAMTSSEMKKIKSALCNVILHNNVAYAQQIRKQAKLLLAQAHEIKKIYERTHHVFIHGQSLKWSVVPLLIKQLIKI